MTFCKEPCPAHLCLEMTKAGMCGYREPTFIAFKVPEGPIDDWYAMGKVTLGGVDATQFSDYGDENDYPETDAEWLAWLKRQLAAPSAVADYEAMMRKPWAFSFVGRPQRGGDAQDPGDENDGRILVPIASDFHLWSKL